MKNRLGGTGIKPDVLADWSYDLVVRNNRDVQFETAREMVLGRAVSNR